MTRSFQGQGLIFFQKKHLPYNSAQTSVGYERCLNSFNPSIDACGSVMYIRNSLHRDAFVIRRYHRFTFGDHFYAGIEGGFAKGYILLFFANFEAVFTLDWML